MRFRSACVLLAAMAMAPAAPAQAHEEKSGRLTIIHPWMRAVAPAQKTAAVFMRIAAADGAPDRLVGAASPDAGSARLHTHRMDGDVMRMRPTDGIDVPGGGEAALESGGFHVMLIGLKTPLIEEMVVPLTLTFERAGAVEIEAVVEAPAARAPSAGAGNGGHAAGHGRGGGR